MEKMQPISDGLVMTMENKAISFEGKKKRKSKQKNPPEMLVSPCSKTDFRPMCPFREDEQKHIHVQRVFECTKWLLISQVWTLI